jgi:uncharacterized protein YciI
LRRYIVKHVLFYELADGAMELAMRHFPAHRARLDAFSAAGTLLEVGTFADAPMGAMAIFSTREAADDFMSEDPFLAHGVVGSWRVREWDVG